MKSRHLAEIPPLVPTPLVIISPTHETPTPLKNIKQQKVSTPSCSVLIFSCWTSIEGMSHLGIYAFTVIPLHVEWGMSLDALDSWVRTGRLAQF